MTLYIFLIYLLSSFSGFFIQLDPVNDPYGTSIIIALLNSFFWFFGVHGYYAILPLIEQLTVTGYTYGAVSNQFLGSFVFVGGAGATLSLIIAILVISKDSLHRKIAMVSIPFAIFGINEIVLFCLPIIFNFRMLLPFILVPVVNAVIASTALVSGFIQLIPGISLINTPLILNSWMATGGDYNGIVLQLVCLLVGVLIYIPFVVFLDQAKQVHNIEIPQLNATFNGVLEEFSSEVDDPLHFLMLQNEKIRKLQDEFFEISEFRFMIYYQPKVNPNTGCVVGCEALIRAIDINDNLIPPGKFVNSFHEARIIHYLDVWVVLEVLRQIKKWKESDLPIVPVSINITASTLTNIKAVNQILEAIGEYKEFIRLEMTEETLADFNENLEQSITQINQFGIPLDIDDFGTGYSSLSYLSKVDFHAIKIDRSFVLDLDNPKNRFLLHAIIQFAQRLNKHIIVEGVETKEQIHELTGYDDLSIQGWFYSKALRADDFQHYLSAANAKITL